MWFPKLTTLIVAGSFTSRLASGGGLEDIDHVVLFMQENRAFDHYFGTMAGVRGFNDANLQINPGNIPVWNQTTSPSLTNDTNYMTPFYLNYLGGNWTEATQCMVAGGNGWTENHAAWNFGRNDHWAVNNTPWSVGFFKRDDIPLHWSLAEEWVVGDMYQESVVSSTRPNRVFWLSGSINVPGSPQTKDEGGYPYIDNNNIPGCEDSQTGPVNCFPLKWKTAAEFYEDAGVSWQVYQDDDNFDDNELVYFEQFQTASPSSNKSLYERGVKGLSLDTFYKQAANGSLPAISYIVGPAELSEHQPYLPRDGAWLQRQIAEAVIKSPKYNSTALIVSYDETGGWFDHLNPYRSPDNTPGEWLDDPWGHKEVGHTFAGPGFRLPFYIISPWTRKGGVYVEHADHSSQIQFIEKWQAAKGRNVTTDEMVSWRRTHMADLVNAFDFENPNFTVPELPEVREPHRDSNGTYDGWSLCQSQYNVTRPPVPYVGEGALGDRIAGQVEHGYKSLRGALTEGRFLVVETDGVALTHGPRTLKLTPGTSDHEVEAQRWIVHAEELGGDRFLIQSAFGNYYICKHLHLCTDKSDAVVFKVGFKPGNGYSFKAMGAHGGYLTKHGERKLAFRDSVHYWKLYSVNY